MKLTLFLFGLLAFVLPARAVAHAEATPAKVPAGSVARIVLRVEGEESVPTVYVSVLVPPGLTDVTFPPSPGWKRTVSRRVVLWSGGEIHEGEFGRFVIRARMPSTPGAEVVFPTLQKYANGKVVHWIGPESSDTPAPRIRLTAAKIPQPPPPPVTTIATVEDEDSGRTAMWAVAAGIALVLFVVGLVFWRRRRA